MSDGGNAEEADQFDHHGCDSGHQALDEPEFDLVGPRHGHKDERQSEEEMSGPRPATDVGRETEPETRDSQGVQPEEPSPVRIGFLKQADREEGNEKQRAEDKSTGRAGRGGRRGSVPPPSPEESCRQERNAPTVAVLGIRAPIDPELTDERAAQPSEHAESQRRSTSLRLMREFQAVGRKRPEPDDHIFAASGR